MNNVFCYIHIPFCTSKCKYCRFASFGNLEQLKIEFYVQFLIKEIKKQKIDFNNLKSIYFGGGTPSVLKSEQLKRIINALKNKINFDKNIEINIEATPITVTEQNLINWKKIGINRISIGVQSLNNDTLVEIGRGEKGDILSALNNVKKNNLNPSFRTSGLPLKREEMKRYIDNVSIDFIIGLPNVKKGEIKKDIEYILDKYDFIKHISVYMLEEYYYPGNWKEISIKEEDYLGEYIEIKQFLKTRGFESYEISNFAKKGYECKHNKAYWNHSEMLAFGLGAHGNIDGIRFSNSEEFSGYYKGEKEIEEKITVKDIFIEKVMFGLRTNGLEKEIYEKLDQNKIKYFIKEKYLILENDILKVTDKGIVVLDYLLKEIL